MPLVIILWVVILSGCHESPHHLVDYHRSYPPETGGTLIDASSAEPSGFIAMVAGDSASSAVANSLFASLIKYNQNLELEGELAKSWQVSPDQRTITFTLKPNLSWADGHPLRSDDVLFTWQLVTHDHTRTPYGSDFKLVTKAETPDALTFRVTYNQPYAPALDTWAGLHILPKHLLEHEDINATAFARQPIGNHYYRLAEWQSGQFIKLVRNQHSCCGSVRIDNIISRIIPDKATQFLEMSADNIDMMGLTPVQYARIFPAHTQLSKTVHTYKELGNSYTYLGFNLKRQPFDDVRVRQAINYAIDKQEIIDGALLGLGKVIASPYKPGTRWSNPHLVPYAYRPVLAKQLLFEAGFRDKDHDGILEKNGKPLVFELLTNQNKERELVAILIQRRLRQIGIEVNIRVLEWSSLLARFIKPKNFDVVILGWGLALDPDQYSIWHSSQQEVGQFNFIGYHNHAVDKLLERGRLTLDINNRQAIYHKLSELLYQDSPIVYLYANYGLNAIHRRIQGISPTPPLAGVGYNSYEWYIPSAYRRYEFSDN